MDKIIIRYTDYDGSKKTENCGIFQTFGRLGAILSREIESRISVAKAGFNKKIAGFTESWTKKFKEQINEVVHLWHSFLLC